MLERDPSPPRPPDCFSPRPRTRPHRPKNAPKKQPQRGLGVAQLEKLRLEEQSKQEAVCLASLHHHRHSNLQHQSQHQQQEQQPQQQQQLHLHNHHHHHHHHHQQQQQQHHNQTSAFCLTRQIKFIEPSPDKSAFAVLSGVAEPHFSLPYAKLNGENVQNSFTPLAGMASGRHTFPLPLLISQQQQQSGDEREPCLSPLSQLHDLCNPGSASLSSAQGFLPPGLPRPATLALPAPFPPVLVSSAAETPWHNQHSDRDRDDLLMKADSAIALFSTACLSSTDKKMQGPAGDLHANSENVHVTARNLHFDAGSLHVSAGNLHEAVRVPFTDLCLRHNPAGAFDSHVPSRNRLESPVVSIAPAGFQTRELSSFQTISSCPTWSSVDQVFKRKRSWASTQEHASNMETFKGVDLNTSADEIESELTERDSNIPKPSTTRDGWSLSPLLSPELMSTENNFKVLSTSRTCSECGLMTTEKYMASSALNVNVSDTLINGAAFLSLRKRNLDYDMQEVETSGEFLTLGPSCSSIRKLGNMHLGTGNNSSGPIMGKPCENAITLQPQQVFSEQVKGAGKVLPMVSRKASSDGLMTMADEYQANYFCTPLHFLAWNKGKDHPGHLEQSTTNESLDLELRLSI